MNVLVAVDASETSVRAVDFVGRMFGAAPPAGLSVTVLHVAHAEGDDKLLASSQDRLTKAGVPAGQIRTRRVVKQSLPEAQRVAAALAIIEEMQAGPYEVVVLGRRGAAAVADTFLGSVAEKVLREARGRTVWVVA